MYAYLLKWASNSLSHTVDCELMMWCHSSHACLTWAFDDVPVFIFGELSVDSNSGVNYSMVATQGRLFVRLILFARCYNGFCDIFNFCQRRTQTWSLQSPSFKNSVKNVFIQYSPFKASLPDGHHLTACSRAQKWIHAMVGQVEGRKMLKSMFCQPLGCVWADIALLELPEQKCWFVGLSEYIDDCTARVWRLNISCILLLQTA